jgi:hypothetical protein
MKKAKLEFSKPDLKVWCELLSSDRPLRRTNSGSGQGVSPTLLL